MSRASTPPPPIPPGRGPLQGLADVAELLAREQPRLASFVRGLTIGALVGAALAGSAVWRRRHGRGPGGDDARR